MRIVLLLFALLMTSCAIGPRLSSFRPARFPQGAWIRIHTPAKEKFTVELVEVRSNGMVVESNSKLCLVRYTDITKARVVDLDSTYGLSGGKEPGAIVSGNLKLVSRFPQGMSPDVLQQLLVLYGQTELREGIK